jgi:hypothetical protein
MKVAWLCAVITLLTGCRTPGELPEVDLAQPGWQIRQGQAVWRANANAPELAGELVWATHPNGRFLLQFLKTPITMVEAQGDEQSWQISFPAQNRRISGSRQRSPSQRLGWLYLASALRGETLPATWTLTRDANKWRLVNPRTGEVIEGYLAQ